MSDEEVEVIKPLYKVPKLLENCDTKCKTCKHFTIRWKTRKHGLMNCQEARMVTKDSPACKDYEISPDLKIYQLRNLKAIRAILDKVSHPKFNIDPSLNQEVHRYFVAALAVGNKEMSYLPSEIRSKDDVLNAINVFQHIQANRDRVIAIKLSMKDIEVELDKMWDLGFSIIIDREPSIGNLRSNDMRQRAVKQIMEELDDRIRSVDLLINKCDIILDNLHQSYFTLHAMVEAAKFGIRELRGF